jgi:ribonuclease BN (tRNA processing enzyme)
MTIVELRLVGTGAILTSRLSASALIDGKVLIDAPNGLTKTLRRQAVDVQAIDVCLFTHFHADHFLDVVFLFTEQGLRTSRDTPLTLIGPPGLADRVEKLYMMSYPESWDRIKANVKPDFIEYDASGGNWSGLGYKITALAVNHPVPVAFGYLIEDSSGVRLGYTGDTVYCDSVEKLAAESSSVLVADSAFPHSRSGHMGLDDVESLARRWPSLQVVANHLSDEVTESSVPNIVFPHDGQVFSVTAN